MDVDWRPVAVNGNGHHGNGHHEDFDIGPADEVVPVNGHYGNGHHDGAEEPQRSLFSWAELMAAEPVKPKRRTRKTQPAFMSMFEWAFEQEREAEAVAAAR